MNKDNLGYLGVSQKIFVTFRNCIPLFFAFIIGNIMMKRVTLRVHSSGFPRNLQPAIIVPNDQ